jgi:hypothetical protein
MGGVCVTLTCNGRARALKSVAETAYTCKDYNMSGRLRTRRTLGPFFVTLADPALSLRLALSSSCGTISASSAERFLPVAVSGQSII